MAKKQTFEEKLKRLEEIVEILDLGDIPLEEMLKNYEEGMALTTELRKYLNEAELRIVNVTKKDDDN
jgi:exodeoxyribonuclease VII small subunit